MLTLKKSLPLLALAVAMTAVGCQDNKGTAAIAPVATAFNPSASLAAHGSACGTALSVDKADGSGMRPLGLTMQIAICGNLAPGKGWKALGMTARSNNVYLRKSGSADYTRADGRAATFAIDGNNDVWAQANGRNYKIGHASSSQHGATIQATDGATFALGAGDSPYDVKEGKNVQDVHIWVSVANLALE